MNLYGIVILGTLLISYVLDLVADLLNLTALVPDVPAEFQDVYDAAAYQKSQTYERVTTRFGFLTSTFGLALTLGFWFAGGFDWVDQLVRGWGWHPIVNGLAYVAILACARIVLTLPFSVYSTFVIEERFGFNRTTPKTFVLDLIKGLALSIVIGAPVLAGVLAFFQYAGAYAWVYCWIAVTLVTLVLQFIAPTWIMPLDEGELRNSILDYARSVNFPLRNLFVMDGSKRSSKSNAFFTGFGKNKRIALFDTLIEKHTVPELVAVLAHEIGHYKKKHILKGMVFSIAHSGVMFFLLSIFLNHAGLFAAFYMQEQSLYAGLIFFGMLYAPVDMILSIFLQIVSRKHEYEADRFAVETYRQPQAMIDGLKKLAKDNLSNLTPHPIYVFLNYSHPPMLQRIAAIRQIQAI